VGVVAVEAAEAVAAADTRRPSRRCPSPTTTSRSDGSAMSGPAHVRVERDGDLAVVTIDRTEKLNALNADVIRELPEAFASLRDDAAVRGVVLTGAGEKAFVAGADLDELSRLDPLGAVALARRGQEMTLLIERFPKPVLAAVGGFALGGGCELALACHLRIASENAKFALPEVGLGLMPGYGGTVRLARVIGLGRAVEMTLTGETIGAEQAREIGLVSAVVPRAELLAKSKELLRRITKNGPVAVRLALESIYRALDNPVEAALADEAALFGKLAATEDMKEGLAAFLEKRKPGFKGR
jgi:enoyl-CoA hydratase